MAKRRNCLVQGAITGITLGYLWVSARTPLALNRAIAVPLGRLLARLVPRVRRVTLANLDMAYGESLTAAEKNEIFWGAVDNLSRVAAEFGHIPRIAEFGRESVIVEGAERVELGRGYLCIGAHLGNWELMGPFMASAGGYKVAEVIRPFDDPRVDHAIDRVRTATGVETIPKDNAGREVLRRLKEGYLVGILVDQSPRDNGVPVTYFGQPCWATIAPVMIAVRAKVPILPISFTRRGTENNYVLKFYPPLELERTGDLRADLLRNSQRCQDAIEQVVRETPEQWLWLHRRWKERPRLAEEWKRREAKDGQ